MDKIVKATVVAADPNDSRTRSEARVWMLSVAGMVVGGALGLFGTFAVTFFVYDLYLPKTLVVPGPNDFVFFGLPIAGAVVFCGLGGTIGFGIGLLLVGMRGGQQAR